MAVHLLEQLAHPPSLQANLFFKALLGLEAGSERSWPKVWVGRSVGHGAETEHDRGGGWKFYYFARRDPQRRTDDVLLDLVEASPKLLDACRLLRDRNIGDGALIQLLGLTFSERPLDPPRWTVYLGEK
jgi:hypothetical protein